jgi:glucose/arabinose dehydrogenase
VSRASIASKRIEAEPEPAADAAPAAAPGDDAVESKPGMPLTTEPVAGGLVSPVALTHAGDGSGRLFIAEQTGQILIVDSNRTLRPRPFLDLSWKMEDLAPTGIGGFTGPGLNPWYEERGLLGLAFHPDYRNNGRFFVFYTLPKTEHGVDHENIVAEYRVSPGDPNLAATNETVILRVDQPEFNHCGGGLAFGPDGYLYVGLGDGGGGGDVHGAIGNAQDTATLPGSILRLDVDGASPYAVPMDNPFVGTAERDEIFAYGFRNPCRLSFDRGGRNALVVPDTGMNVWEEINFVERGGNYGWRAFEGSQVFDAPLAATLGLRPADAATPAHEYGLGPAGLFLVGGHVYRGAACPELAGAYVYGYFTMRYSAPDGLLCYLAETGTGRWERFEFSLPDGERLGRFVKGFGEGEDGELYLLSSGVPGPSGTSGDVRLLKANRVGLALTRP